MKKISLILFLIAGINSFLILSCSKSNDSTACNINTASVTVNNATTVNYHASKSGDGTMSSLTYQGNSGSVTVNNPLLPFSMSVNVNAGTVIGISAAGKTTKGGLSVSLDALDGSSQIVQFDSCGTN